MADTRTETRTHALTDLEMLFDFAKDAEIAAMSYTSAACMTQEPRLRRLFTTLAASSLESQERTVKLIRELGGRF